MKKLGLIIVTAIVLSLALCGITQGQSRFFWVDLYYQELHSSRTDGSELTSTSANNPTVATVDQAGGWLYWLTLNAGFGQYTKLYRAPLHDLSAQAITIDTGYGIGGLEIDSKTGFVYWAAPLELGDFVSIRRALPESSTIEDWLVDAGLTYGGMDLDSRARLLFYSTDHGLVRAHLDLGKVEPVQLDWGSVPEPTQGTKVALDTLYRKVYWADRGAPGLTLAGNITRIYRTQYMGGQPTLVYEASDATIKQLVFDPASRTLYWVEQFMEDGSNVLAMKKMIVGEPLPAEGKEVFRLDKEPLGLSIFADTGPAQLLAPGSDEPSETTVELRWNQVLGSPRYDVVVASDPLFNDVVFQEDTPGTSSQFVAPVAERSYYWRVQSNACFIAPHWSATGTINVGDSGPLAARLVFPEPDALIEPNEIFDWDAAPDASSYTFQVSESPSFSQAMIDANGLVETERSVEDLVRGSTYYWRVAGVDEEGRYTFTAPRTFSVAELLGAVVLTNPADGSDGVDAYAAFAWSSLDRADSYEFELSKNADVSDPVVSLSTSETELVVEEPLTYSETYYWRVRAVNRSGPGDWSPVWSFIVAIGTGVTDNTEIPTATRLLQPYPNPTSGIIMVPIELADPLSLTIDVYDVAGRLVLTRSFGEKAAGRHALVVDATSLNAGAYFVAMSGRRSEHKSVLILR